MRFLKRLSALLLSMLSLCSLSLVACKKEIVKNPATIRPSVESELPESVTSEENATSDYVEPVAGARERLDRALEVIVVTYYATLIKQHGTELLERLEG